MSNDTRSGLKISGNRSYGGMNPPQSRGQCGIILTENGTKGSQYPKKSFEKSVKKPGELFLKTT